MEYHGEAEPRNLNFATANPQNGLTKERGFAIIYVGNILTAPDLD
jgi:hypothetical protein